MEDKEKCDIRHKKTIGYYLFFCCYGMYNLKNQLRFKRKK